MNTPQVLVPVILFSILYFILIIAGITATWRYCCAASKHHHSVQDDIMIPMVTLDAATPSITRVMGAKRGVLQLEHWYNKLSALF
jgi:hypothetical protein